MKHNVFEKRKSKRSSLSFFIKVRDYSKTLFHEAEVVDISNGGMKIRATTETPRIGFAVIVRVPVINSKEESIPVLTMVKWIHKEIDGMYLVGLKYMI